MHCISTVINLILINKKLTFEAKFVTCCKLLHIIVSDFYSILESNFVTKQWNDSFCRISCFGSECFSLTLDKKVAVSSRHVICHFELRHFYNDNNNNNNIDIRASSHVIYMTKWHSDRCVAQSCHTVSLCDIMYVPEPIVKALAAGLKP